MTCVFSCDFKSSFIFMCLVINCNLQTPNHVLINLNVLRHERNEVCLPTTMTFLTNLAFPPPTATKPHTPKSLSLAGLGWDYSLPARNTRSNATKKKGQHEKKEGSYDGCERHNFYRCIRENCFLSFKISSYLWMQNSPTAMFRSFWWPKKPTRNSKKRLSSNNILSLRTTKPILASKCGLT